jgi:hypothetical protein
MGRYDRGITVLLLMAWPAVAGMLARRRWLVAALLMLAVAVTVTEFDSRASILVLVAAFGALALAVAARLPRVVAGGMIGAVASSRSSFRSWPVGGPSPRDLALRCRYGIGSALVG